MITEALYSGMVDVVRNQRQRGLASPESATKTGRRTPLRAPCFDCSTTAVAARWSQALIELMFADNNELGSKAGFGQTCRTPTKRGHRVSG